MRPDPRLANPLLLALASVRLRERQQPALVVVYLNDGESSKQAIRRHIGRDPHSWETCLVVEYAADIDAEAQGDSFE